MDWTHPVFEVEHAGTRIDAAVVSFSIQTHSQDAADSGQVILADPEGDLAPAFLRGSRVKVRWGYRADAQLTPIFDGLIRAVSPQGQQVALDLIDFQGVLQAPSRRIVRTWEQVTPAELAGDLLAGTGITLAAAVPGLTIDRFPVNALTPREALQQLVAWLRTQTGEPYRSFIRGGQLVLGLPDYGQASVYTIETGVNLVDQWPGERGRRKVETLVAPVLHSQVVTLDGVRYFAQEVTYRWDQGGRTILSVVPCA